MVWLLEIEGETVCRGDLFGGKYCAVSFIPSKRVMRGPAPHLERFQKAWLVSLWLAGGGVGYSGPVWLD